MVWATSSTPVELPPPMHKRLPSQRLTHALVGSCSCMPIVACPSPACRTCLSHAPRCTRPWISQPSCVSVTGSAWPDPTLYPFTPPCHPQVDDLMDLLGGPGPTAAPAPAAAPAGAPASKVCGLHVVLWAIRVVACMALLAAPQSEHAFSISEATRLSILP